MVCPYCGSETKVYNSRRQNRANQTWRRRQCLTCSATFSTLETIDFTTALLVNRPGHSTEPFERDKLFESVYDSLKHKQRALSDATALTATIIGKLGPHIESASIDRDKLVAVTAEVLKHFDQAAHVQYLAYHQVKT